jgi:hypothetical protein
MTEQDVSRSQRRSIAHFDEIRLRGTSSRLDSSYSLSDGVSMCRTSVQD